MLNALNLMIPATAGFHRYGKVQHPRQPLRRQGAASSLLADGRVLIVWEETGAELYDPETGSFTTTGNPFQGYNYAPPVATLLIDGKVLSAGGLLDSAELYNVSTGTFAATGNMTTGRGLHTATLLPGGDVFDDRQLFAPRRISRQRRTLRSVAGAFTSTGTMTAARSSHTATLLPDGRVLIAGGSTFGSDLPCRTLQSQSIWCPRPSCSLFQETGAGRARSSTRGPPELLRPAIPAFPERCWNLWHRLEGWQCHPSASGDRRAARRDPVFRQGSRIREPESDQCPRTGRRRVRGRSSCAPDLPRPPE